MLFEAGFDRGKPVVHSVEKNSLDVREAQLSDRRRPGRRDYQNPKLIALLRGQFDEELRIEEVQATPVTKSDPASDHDRPGLIAARGVGYGLLFGGLIWGLIGLLWYFV
jgi:hypothetical protein